MGEGWYRSVLHRLRVEHLGVRIRPAGETRLGRISGLEAALEATQGQMDGFFSQLPYKCHLKEVASVGD
jgi:hypothetical protein